MPQRTWPDEREREYEHIKAGLQQRSDSKGMSQATAKRTGRQGTGQGGEAKRSRTTMTTSLGEQSDIFDPEASFAAGRR